MSSKGGGNSSSTAWQWDAQREQYYYIDPERRQYVFQNGVRIPMTQTTPRSAAPVPALPRNSGEQFSAGSQRSAEYQVIGSRGSPPSQQSSRSPFRIQPRSFFRRFRVFAVRAQELPTSSGVSVLSSLRPANTGEHGTISGVQRYVVISVPADGSDFVWALPIASYGGQGVGREGVVKHQHGIVHTDRTPPESDHAELPNRGEGPMLPNPIRINPHRPDERLHRMSRINYGQATQININTPVHEVGVVHEKSEAALIYQHEYVQKEQGKIQQQRSAETQQPRAATDALDEQAERIQAARRRLQAAGWSEEEIMQKLTAAYQSQAPGMLYDDAQDAVRRFLRHRR